MGAGGVQLALQGAHLGLLHLQLLKETLPRACPGLRLLPGHLEIPLHAQQLPAHLLMLPGEGQDVRGMTC